jgi:hypothetical protein
MEICIDPALAKVFREIVVASHINGVVLSNSLHMTLPHIHIHQEFII